MNDRDIIAAKLTDLSINLENEILKIASEHHVLPISLLQAIQGYLSDILFKRFMDISVKEFSNIKGDESND